MHAPNRIPGDLVMKQAREDLLAWERSERLAELRWRDVPLWRLIRNRIIGDYLERQGVRGRSNYNRPGFRAAAAFLVGMLVSVGHIFRLRRRRVLFIGFPRRRREGTVWVDPLSDPLIEVLGESDVLCIEKPFGGVHFRPPRTRHIVYYDWVTAVASAASFLFEWSGRRAARDALSALADSVSRRFDMQARDVRRMTSRALVQFRVEAALMRAALSLIKPEVVLLTSRTIHFPIIYASKCSGARVLELQHGVPNTLGYKCVTVWDPHLDPDWMLTFGTYWNERDWGLPRDRIQAIGYRHIWQSRAALMSRRSDRGDAVMLLSQPEMSARLANAFWKIAAANDDVQFLLKLHPQDIADWQRRYPVGLRTNVRVCNDPAADLYGLFSECCAVVGHNSTALFEASFFGLKVGILNFDGTNECPALEHIGRFNLFELREPRSLAAMLAAPIDDGVPDTPFLADFDARQFERLVGRAAPGRSA